MEVNEQELEWMYNGLMAQRALRDSPTSIPLWEAWKQTLLDKVNHERTKLDTPLKET